MESQGPRQPAGRPKCPKGVPRLCRRLWLLGAGTRYERRLETLILGAASILAREPKVLFPRQFRLFVLAYIDDCDADQIARRLGVTPRAVTDRLNRVSRRLEARLMAFIAARAAGERDAERLAVALTRARSRHGSSKHVTPEELTGCERLLAMLEGLVHREARG